MDKKKSFRIGMPVKTSNRGQYWFLVMEKGKVIDQGTVDDPFITTIIRPTGLKVCLAILMRKYKITVQVGGSEAARKVVFGSDYTEEAVKDFRIIAGLTGGKPFIQGVKNWWKETRKWWAN